MRVRSGGFYHDDHPPGPQRRNIAALAILLVIVSALGAAIVLLTRALLFDRWAMTGPISRAPYSWCRCYASFALPSGRANLRGRMTANRRRGLVAATPPGSGSSSAASILMESSRPPSRCGRGRPVRLRLKRIRREL